MRLVFALTLRERSEYVRGESWELGVAFGTRRREKTCGNGATWRPAVALERVLQSVECCLTSVTKLMSDAVRADISLAGGTHLGGGPGAV